ncbi:MAG: hypothetical protein BJ554DRAFT_6051 [Olpidium bornovanus]|uniref:Uncharacterized protein n=1 Tax=Olpidium bornovanus TaxID=278681 RepID=A0A8H8DL04_9FUNG|nr:MAG: hypothetical protein BJ554DRAFT_6051 [Olpidium bornovanus]
MLLDEKVCDEARFLRRSDMRALEVRCDRRWKVFRNVAWAAGRIRTRDSALPSAIADGCVLPLLSCRLLKTVSVGTEVSGKFGSHGSFLKRRLSPRNASPNSGVSNGLRTWTAQA